MFEQLRNIDRNLLLAINSHKSPFLDSLMWQFSSTIPTVTLILVFAYFFYKRFGQKKTAEFILACVILFACTDSTSNLAKHTFKRYRPTHNLEIKNQVKKVNNYEGGKYGFFSGHSATTFGLAMFLFLCAKWLKPKLKLLFFIYPLIVVYSRMYLGVHYPSDIFLGMLDGFFFAGLVFYIFNKYFFKFNEEKIITS
jgi:undecaprenyl-diphosphatase